VALKKLQAEEDMVVIIDNLIRQVYWDLEAIKAKLGCADLSEEYIREKSIELEYIGQKTSKYAKTLIKAKQGSARRLSAVLTGADEIAATTLLKEASDPTVLIVEDDVVDERLLVMALERAGFSVLVARDGREATNIINNAKPTDIVLVDNMLPYVSGLQLLKVIRANRAWSETAVVMLTDNPSEREVVYVMNNGAQDYIEKPFNPRELVARLNRFVH